jgi:hypothetical protein
VKQMNGQFESTVKISCKPRSMLLPFQSSHLQDQTLPVKCTALPRLQAFSQRALHICEQALENP